MLLGRQFIIRVMVFNAIALGIAMPAFAKDDSREWVELPAMMQDHMLSNMRDHLRAIEDIFAALAKSDADLAADIAEKRLGMSSLGLHGAEHMAPFMPEDMRAIGTQLHHAASRFVIAAQDADLANSKEATAKVFGALQEIVENCNACHRAYRIK